MAGAGASTLTVTTVEALNCRSSKAVARTAIGGIQRGLVAVGRELAAIGHVGDVDRPVIRTCGLTANRSTLTGTQAGRRRRAVNRRRHGTCAGRIWLRRIGEGRADWR